MSNNKTLSLDDFFPKNRNIKLTLNSMGGGAVWSRPLAAGVMLKYYSLPADEQTTYTIEVVDQTLVDENDCNIFNDEFPVSDLPVNVFTEIIEKLFEANDPEVKAPNA